MSCDHPRAIPLLRTGTTNTTQRPASCSRKSELLCLSNCELFQKKKKYYHSVSYEFPFLPAEQWVQLPPVVSRHPNFSSTQQTQACPRLTALTETFLMIPCTDLALNSIVFHQATAQRSSPPCSAACARSCWRRTQASSHLSKKSCPRRHHWKL